MSQTADHLPPSRTFWLKVEKTDTCWLWKGVITASGYGRFNSKYAHRLAYEALAGAINPRLELDHLCRVRNCVNPDHLEAVTHRENLRRSNNPYIHFDATHCQRGHRLSGENVYVDPRTGNRECRTCRKARMSRRKREVLCECGSIIQANNMARHRARAHSNPKEIQE